MGLLALDGGAAQMAIVLDGASSGRTFQGLGALSAGASSRLLIDYPEPQRSEILDYLFRTKYGAAIQHLKVEIGGEINSTDGTEPTHMRTRSEENYSRGYEWWLMKEAKKRNPAIILDALAWGAPAWIGGGNFFSQDMADYIVHFIKGAKSVHNLDIDYTGVWNERSYDTSWISLLRRTLDANGLAAVKIVAADSVGGWWIADQMLADPQLYAAVDTLGVHYINFQSSAAAKGLGKPLWASEDGPWGGTWSHAQSLAQIFNRNYIQGQITSTITWSLVSSYYNCLPIADSGPMLAREPWSGHYEVQPGIWAFAHTTQFTHPGWKYLDGQGCALLPGGNLTNAGSIVTLRSPVGADYTIVVETLEATAPLTITFQLTNGLSQGLVHVWVSSADQQFIETTPIQPAVGGFSCTFQPNTICTLSTLGGQTRGATAPPPSAPWSLPYADNFESYSVGKTPKYFSDQAGCFETVDDAAGGNRLLRQVVMQRGIQWIDEWSPQTAIGDNAWADYDVSMDFVLETNGFALLHGRAGNYSGYSTNPPTSYWLAASNAPAGYGLYYGSKLLAFGKSGLDIGTWHNLRLAMQGDAISAYVDGSKVAGVLDAASSSGLTGLGSGWHAARFDNFIVRRLHKTGSNLAIGAAASASSWWSSDYTVDKANDGNSATRWNSGPGTSTNEWLQFDFGGAIRFNRTVLLQFMDRIQGYAIQYWNGAAWANAFIGTQPGTEKKDTFPTVTASKIRLLITTNSQSTSIYEFGVYYDANPGTNLAPAATANASSLWSSAYAARYANDGNNTTRWNSGLGTSTNEWLQLEFPAPVTFNHSAFSQYMERILAYRIQFWDGAAWKNACVGTSPGLNRTDAFPTVTSGRVRLFIDRATESTSLYEFQLYNQPSAEQSPVCINEWMVNNVQTLKDPADGNFQPWFELYNSGSASFDLSGFYLSGSPSNRFQFAIPSGYTIPAGGWLLVWADGHPEENSPANADLHVSFPLIAPGMIRLCRPDGTQLDAVDLDPQPNDTSSGSAPDGDIAIVPLPSPSPRTSNTLLGNIELVSSFPGQIQMRLNGIPCRMHKVQSTETLAPGPWNDEVSQMADALGVVQFRLAPPAGGTKCFYRVILQ